MNLGTASQVKIGVEDLHAAFYTFNKLGFRIINEGKQPNPWMQVTDGSLLVLLAEDGTRDFVYSYFDKDMDTKVRKLEEMGVEITNRFDHGGRFVNGMIEGPDKVSIELNNFNPVNLYQPKGKILRTMTDEELQDPETYPNPKAGIYAELSFPVSNLENAIAFWQPMGFEALSINDQPYPWGIVGDELNTMGFYQGSEFTRPAITYFAKDMRERIQNLKQEGLYNIRGFQTEDEDYAHGVITLPEGHQIFLFSF